MWGSLRFLLSYFVFARSLRSALIKGGGWDKISDFAVGKGERVKFKFFAIPIKFYLAVLAGEKPSQICFCFASGERTISNAEVSLPRTPTLLGWRRSL